MRAAVNLSEWSFDWIIGVAGVSAMHLRAARLCMRGRAPRPTQWQQQPALLILLCATPSIHPSIHPFEPSSRESQGGCE